MKTTQIEYRPNSIYETPTTRKHNCVQKHDDDETKTGLYQNKHKW